MEGVSEAMKRPMDPKLGELAIMNHTGDLKVMWDPDSKDETKAAKKQFEEMREKGYQAFAVDRKGEKTEVISKFDPDAGRIIMAPPLAGG
jgi:hypothetical protein